MDINGVDPITIREVWAHNLKHEFQLISDVIDHYPCISMDTEFPGVVFKSDGNYLFLSPAEKYKLLKSNVDVLHLIQLGITLYDADGILPDLGTGNCRFVWQFNFSDFDLTRDLHARDSIQLLIDHGIDLEKNRVLGINSFDFAELMMSSGLVCSDTVSWVTFQGAYDIGYLLKILTNRELPSRLNEFSELVSVFFGNKLYDVKYLMRFCNLYGGLNEVARGLDLDRVVGRQHQAGSDSLLTRHVFYRMRDTYFVNDGPKSHAGILHGFEYN